MSTFRARSHRSYICFREERTGQGENGLFASVVFSSDKMAYLGIVCLECHQNTGKESCDLQRHSIFLELDSASDPMMALNHSLAHFLKDGCWHHSLHFVVAS